MLRHYLFNWKRKPKKTFPFFIIHLNKSIMKNTFEILLHWYREISLFYSIMIREDYLSMQGIDTPELRDFLEKNKQFVFKSEIPLNDAVSDSEKTYIQNYSDGKNEIVVSHVIKSKLI